MGYLGYSLIAALVSLWLLFPAQSVRDAVVRVLATLSPDVAWRVGEVELRWPFMLRVTAVEGYTAGRDLPALRIDRLDIGPDWVSSIREQALWLRYDLLIGSGVVHGRLVRRSTPLQYTFSGTARGIALDKMPLLGSRLGRNIQGLVSATYEGQGCPGVQNACSWKMQCTLENGRLSLVRPLLGHRELPFSRVSMLLSGKGKEMGMTEGKIDSLLGSGWFNGTVILAADPMQSQLRLRGGLHPQPAFFEGVEQTVALESLRRAVEEKALPFNLSGTLRHPGIHFESLAMEMFALEKETR